LAKSRREIIKQYPKNEQKEDVYMDTKLVQKTKYSIFYNKEPSLNKLAETQPTKFKTYKSKK